MTALTWDDVGERTYQTGLDRGVLYLNDGTAVAWNGLTSVEEDPNFTLNSYYLDGVKYLDTLSPGDFSAKLKAITYPDEFDTVMGVQSSSGLAYHDQSPQSFGLSYRTKIGTDLDPDYAYRIHVLYGLHANPDAYTFQTVQDKLQPIEFGWALTGAPQKIPFHRSTVHVSFHTGEVPPDVLAQVEDTLYGTDPVDGVGGTPPTLMYAAGWTSLFSGGAT
jgi:hypothetical protein